MLIKTIESKQKLVLITLIVVVLGSVLSIGAVSWFAFDRIAKERNQIYVLDNGIPLLVSRSDMNENREVEYRSHINSFHYMFFNLPPDNDFIEYNMEKAMYLIDNSGLKQYNNLKEKGFYNSILATSSLLSIKTDSIVLSNNNTHFMYYGIQRIERKTSVLKRSLITEGDIKDVPRSTNNPHGALISNWKTIQNKDLEYKAKKDF